MKWPWSRSKPAAAGHDITELYAGKAAAFVQYAATKGAWVFDYSDTSVGALEDMLASLVATAGAMPSLERDQLVDGASFYLLEVARRQFGGKYEFYHERRKPLLVVGKPAFSAAWLAHDKVAGRLAGDAGDNLPFHYQGLREAVASQTSVLYV